MKALDGRNSHDIPKIIDVSEFVAVSKYTATNYNDETISIYDLLLDGRHVPCVSSSHVCYMFILCAEYKTAQGFMNWLKRAYPYAEKAGIC